MTGIAQYKTNSELPVIPEDRLFYPTTITWPRLLNAGVVWEYYQIVPIGKYRNCNALQCRILYTGPTLARSHVLSVTLFDKLGDKYVQSCSRSVISRGAGNKVNATWSWTSTNSLQSPAAYSTDSVTQLFQNNISDPDYQFYTSAETGTAASQVTTITNNYPTLTEEAIAIIAWSNLVADPDEPLTDLKVRFWGMSI